MNPHSFTLEAAQEICEDFEDLIDTEFRFNGVDILVDNVVVVPYEAQAKSSFFSALKDSDDAAALLNAYEAEEYDVIIVASAGENEAMKHYIPVMQYVQENGVAYNFPEA